MRKILYNKSGEELNILGRQISNDSSFEVPQQKWLDLAADIREQGQVYSWINSGDIVVNDGTRNLTSSRGLRWCENLDSIEVSNNGVFEIEKFNKINFQGNIIVGIDGDELNVDAAGQSNVGNIFSLDMIHNGTFLNEYGDVGENIKISESPHIIPFNCKLIGITFSNSNSGVDVDLELWKAEKNDDANKEKILTWEVRNARTGYKKNITNVFLNAGDKLALYGNDKGGNSVDVNIVLYFKIINDNNNEEFTENFSGDF